LPADTSGKLAPIIGYLQSHPTAKAAIQGFHDPRGDAETNAMLAKNRAGAIWNVLTEAGISRDRVILEKPLNTTGTGSLAEARRAEVSVRNE
jgi:K(+)-stimulated pyrophosphate-energized sodium pump